MTELNRPLTRKTRAHRHEQGRDRRIIVTLDGSMIGLRLEKTQQTFWQDIESVYCSAVRSEVVRQQREKRKAKR